MSLLQTPESRIRIASWLMWVTPALWSVNYIVARSAPGVVEPHMLALGRWALAGLIVGFIARSELWRERRSTLALAGQYLVLGALGMLVCGAWVYQGAKTTSAPGKALTQRCSEPYRCSPAGMAIWTDAAPSSAPTNLYGVAHVRIGAFKPAKLLPCARTSSAMAL